MTPAAVLKRDVSIQFDHDTRIDRGVLDRFRRALNGWIGQLFNRTNINATVAALLDSEAGQRKSGGRDVAERRLLDAEPRVRRFQDAFTAGVDPAALVDPLNRAQAECAAAQAEIDNAPASTTLTDAEVYAMIDSWVMLAPRCGTPTRSSCISSTGDLT
jgi:hypothetical protein